METIPINFNHVTVIRVTLLILGVTFTWYMGSVKNKSRVAWLIMGFFAGMSVFFFTLLAEMTPKGILLDPILTISIALALTSISQIGYNFPHNDQPRERRAVLILYLICTGLMILLGAYHDFLIIRSGDISEESSTVNLYMFMLLPIMTLLTIGIFIRQMIYYTLRDCPKTSEILKISEVLRAFWYSPNAEIRILRSLIASMMFGLIPGIAQPLLQTGLINFLQAGYFINMGILLLVVAIFFTYLNSTLEQVSFIIKLVSIPLVTVLILLGIVGLIMTERLYLQAEYLRQVQLVQSYQAIKFNDLTILPKTVLYVVKRPLNTTAYQLLFSQQVGFDPIFLAGEDLLKAQNPTKFQPQITTADVTEFQQSTSLPVQSFLRFGKNINNSPYAVVDLLVTDLQSVTDKNLSRLSPDFAPFVIQTLYSNDNVWNTNSAKKPRKTRKLPCPKTFRAFRLISCNS